MKNTNFCKRMLSALLVLSLMCVTSVAAFATDDTHTHSPEESVAVSAVRSGDLFDEASTMPNGTCSKSIYVPESGNYKIMYAITTEQGKRISFYVDTGYGSNPAATGYGHISGVITRYYSAGSYIKLNVMTEGLTVGGYSFTVYKA